MASLFNTKISNTYVGLIKTIDNAVISASLRELTDGSGNQTGVYLNNAGDFKASGTLEFGSLKDTGENITITKFVDEADGIASNDNDTTIPTSAAVVDYVAARITLEDLDFSGDSGTGSVDLDSQTFAVVGTANEIETSAGSQQLQIGLPDNVTIGGNLQVNGLLKGNNNIVIKDTSDRTMAAFYGGGKVELYFNDSKKFETTSDGATVTGGLTATGGSVFTGATFSSNVDWADSAKARFGTGNDLEIFHNGSQTYLQNYVGEFNFIQHANDQDIIFKCDDGSGGVADYFRLDGSTEEILYSQDFKIIDNKSIKVGNSNDFQIVHNGTNTELNNLTGNLNIKNSLADADIGFYADNGSGGTTEYLRIDGGLEQTVVSKNFRFDDNVQAMFGSGIDLRIYHDGSNSFISDTGTGDLRILGSVVRLKSAGDENMIVGVENAGVTLYYDAVAKLTTTSTGVTVTGVLVSDGLSMGDNEQLRLGDGEDLRLFHNGTDSSINNYNGDLYITNQADDKDIIFRTDDGSGGFTPYFRVDGGEELTSFSKDLRLNDNVNLLIGSGSADLQLYHTGSISYIRNNTGDLDIRNQTGTASDFYLRNTSNNGVQPYITLEGANETTLFGIRTKHSDNIKAMFGDSNDFQIYHDGSNSYLNDNGTGNLIIAGTQVYITNAAGSEYKAQFTSNGSVNLYYDNSKKFETTSTGVSVTGDADVSGQVYVGTVDSFFKDNNLRFNSAGAAYIDHNTVGQSFIFRGSSSSSLDTTTLTITAAGDLTTGRNLTVAGDLTVNGTTTTVNTQTLAVEDPLISLAKDNSANSVDVGFYGKYTESGTAKYLGLYADASDSNTFNLFSGLQTEPTTTVDKTATGYNSANLILSSLYVNDYVYHNGDTNSYLGFSANDNFILRTNASTKIFADATNTYLYFDGNQKLRTTTDGVTITGGIITSDDITIANDSIGSSPVTQLHFDGNNISDGGGYNVDFRTSSNDTANRFVARIQALRGSSATSSLGFFTETGSALTRALLLDSSQNATFGGTISAGAITSSASVIASGNSNSFGNTTTGALTADSVTSSGSLSITGNSNSIGITTFTGNVTISDGNSPQLRVTDTTNTVTAKLMSDNTTGFVGTHTNHDLSFIINNNVKGTLDTSGNLGLNTNSPNHKLDIYAEANVGLRVHRPNSALDSTEPIGIGFSTRSDGNTSTTDTRSGLFSYYNGNLFLSAATSDITSDPYASRKLEITSAGNVVLSANLMPQSENNFNIGSSSTRWEDLYVDDGHIRDAYIDEYIYHNGDTDTYIRFTDNTLTFRTAGDDGLIIDSNRNATFSSDVELSTSGKKIKADFSSGGTTRKTELTLYDSTNGAFILNNEHSSTGGIQFQIDGTDALSIAKSDKSATFAGDIDIADSKKINIGDSADLQIYHDGSHSFLDNDKGNLYLRNTGADSSSIIIRNDDAGDIHLDNDFAGNIIFSTSAINRMVLDSTGELKVNKSIHLGNDSTVLTPAQYSMLIEAPSGNSTNINMYTHGSSVFNITSDGTTGQIGWGSGADREVNLVNTGAGTLKVGINNGAPTSVLSVKTLQDTSFDEGIGVIRSNSSQTGYINMVGGAMNINAPSSIPIKFRDGGTSNLEINANGHTVVNNDLNVEGGIYGKSYTQTSAGSVTSIIDTGIAVEAGVWELFYMGNSNDAGSGSYRSITTGLIIVTVDFSNPLVVNEIRFEQTSITGGGSGNNNLSVAVKILQGGSEYDELNHSTSGQTIRLKITGWNGAANVGTAGQARITRRL